MSSFYADGSARCWVCFDKGENRFFNGPAALDVHKKMVHAPRYKLDTSPKADVSWYLHAKKYASGDDTGFNGTFSSNIATPTWLGIASFKQLENTKRRLRFQDQTAEDSSARFHFSKVGQGLEDGADYEIKCLKNRIKEAQDEINARKTVVQKLQEDLDQAQKKEMEFQVKETQMDGELQAAKRQLKIATNELHQAMDEIQHERKEKMQLQQVMESQLNSKKQHILKLQDELDNERTMSKQKDHDIEELAQIRRKVNQMEKELMMEKRLKLEAKQSKEECQAEIDELMYENEEIKRMMRQYRHDLERLHDENQSLIADYNSMLDRADNHDAEEQLLLVQKVMEQKIVEERNSFSLEVERCQLEAAQVMKKYEQTVAELEKTRSELDAAVLYRQDDIDRLLKEKQALKLDLKSKKEKLKIFEGQNDNLSSHLKAVERQLIECQNGGKNSQVESSIGHSHLEKQLLDKCKEIEQLQSRIDELKAAQNDDKSWNLQEELNQMKVNQLASKKFMADIEMKNEMLNGLLKEAERQLHQEREEHQQFATFSKEQERTFEAALAKLEQRNISLERSLAEIEIQDHASSKQLAELEEKNKELTEKLEICIERATLDSVQEQLNDQSSMVESLLREKEGLQLSFEEERQDLNEKLDKVLDANVDLERNCIDLEAILEEKALKIQSLETYLADMESSREKAAMLVNDNQKLQNDLSAAQSTLTGLEAQVAQLKEDQLKKDQETTANVEKLKEKVKVFEDDKATAKSQISELMQRMEQVKAAIHSKEEKFQEEKLALQDQIQQSKSREDKLEESNSKLKKELDQKSGIVKDLQVKNQRLLEKVKDLETEESSIANSREQVKELESSCSKLKTELQSETEEVRQSQAKQADLLKKLKDNEEMIASLNAKLITTEQQLKHENALCGTKFEKAMAESEQMIKQLTEIKEQLLGDNLKLSEKIAEMKKKSHSAHAEKEKELSEKLSELSNRFKEMKEKEAQIQKHNYEIKKTLEAKDLHQKCLEQEVKDLKAKVELKESDETINLSTIEALKKEVEDWQRKFDDLASSLADTEANLQIIAVKSAQTEKQLKAEGKKLKQELDATIFSLEQKEADLSLAQQRGRNNDLLSRMVDERCAEIEAKNHSIEELGKENKTLIDEKKKLHKTVDELEAMIERYKQEKECYEGQLESQQTTSPIDRNTKNDLRKACDEIQQKDLEFEDEENVTEDVTVEEEYLANHLEEYDYVEAIEPFENDEIEAKNMASKAKDTVSAATKCIEQTNLSSIYESDFEEESQTTSNIEKGDNSEENSISEDILQNEMTASDDEVNFDEDDDDFWDTLPKDPLVTTANDVKSILKNGNGKEKLKDEKEAKGMESTKMTAAKTVSWDGGENQVNVFQEIMEVEDEENVTEDISVEEIYLANHIKEYDYVEAIEPFEEDESQEQNMASAIVENHREAENRDDKMKTDQAVKSIIVGNEGVGPKYNVIDEEEDDMLTSFVTKQRAKKAESTSKNRKFSSKQQQMAKDMGFDDDLEIENLISDIELSDEGHDEEDRKQRKSTIATASPVEASSPSSSESDSDTGMKPQQSGILHDPSLTSTRPLGRSMMLPPLGPRPRSLPPLRKTKKAKN